MAVSFTRVSSWLFGGREKDHHNKPAAGSSPLSASSDFDLWDPDNVTYSPRMGAKMRSSARPRRKWNSREERSRGVDPEFDAVLMPSDGCGCLSGSESDESDCSIGWLEPHAPDFFSDDGGESEAGSGFAVLVKCYGRGRCERGGQGPSGENHILGTIDVFSSEGKKCVEQWLSSMLNS